MEDTNTALTAPYFVSVAGMPRARILKLLYNNAPRTGIMAVFNGKGNLSEEEALEIFREQLQFRMDRRINAMKAGGRNRPPITHVYFDYVHGTAIKTDIPLFEDMLENTGYDDRYGKGAMQRALYPEL